MQGQRAPPGHARKDHTWQINLSTVFDPPHGQCSPRPLRGTAPAGLQRELKASWRLEKKRSNNKLQFKEKHHGQPRPEEFPQVQVAKPILPAGKHQHDLYLRPHQIDLGQCNDAIVAVAIAQALAGLFGVLA
jgi:hypothetical protein